VVQGSVPSHFLLRSLHGSHAIRARLRFISDCDMEKAGDGQDRDPAGAGVKGAGAERQAGIAGIYMVTSMASVTDILHIRARCSPFFSIHI
jgi:hypothetical protein